MKAAIFDMDGTMFDTERLSLQGWLSAAQKYKYPITESVVNQIRGTNTAYSKKLFYDLFGEQVDYELARMERTAYIDRYMKEQGVPVKEGLFELLDHLKDKGYKLAVATSTHEELAKEYLKLAKVYDYFDVCVYGDGIKKGKPDPEIFLEAAKRVGAAPKDCVVFEDSPHGIKAGYEAKMKVIAIPDMTPIEGETLEIVDACCENLRKAIPLV